ncbi:hypothetical protein [Arthrobacter sp. PAMC 25486]|uniref:hypothetical protein n=1 Tax=Arthrobacter sp. PAMC 25486 TaxID=1494608 RepID=UPI00057061AC|nr:hypothetical protein [Arthrobacter sp. PAMC 25486]
MSNQDFDRRYPAMFQPGTDAESSAIREGVLPVQEVIPQVLEDAPQLQDESISGAEETAAAVQPDKRWMLAPAAAVLLFGGGLFSLSAQYWATSSSGGPPGYPGTVYAEWGTDLAPAASALIVAGLGIAAASLFLVSRRTAERESAGRKAFGVVAVLVAVVALLALYSFALFPGQADYAAAAYDGVPRRTPWPTAIRPTGTWTLTLALFMLAVLVIVPRRWAEEIAGTETPGAQPSAPDFSTKNALWCGGLAVVGGLAALLAASILPAVDSAAPRYPDAQAFDAGFIMMPIGLPMLVAGLLVLAWATIQGSLGLPSGAVTDKHMKEAKEQP